MKETVVFALNCRMAWVFNSFRLDPDRFDLSRDSVPVRVEPQVLALLIHLIRNRDRMVTKDEIAERVWKRRAVADASISSAIRAARAAVGDDGTTQIVIRTIHGRGFRFVADVVETRSAQVAAPDPKPDAAGRLASKPSISVLPFRFAIKSTGHANLPFSTALDPARATLPSGHRLLYGISL